MAHPLTVRRKTIIVMIHFFRLIGSPPERRVAPDFILFRQMITTPQVELSTQSEYVRFCYGLNSFEIAIMMKARIPAAPRLICRGAIPDLSSDLGNGFSFLQRNRDQALASASGRRKARRPVDESEARRSLENADRSARLS
jgi:hypothetical protein